MRYVILSDIHANYTALKAIEDNVRRMHFDGDLRYWFLGDLVGYGPASEAVDCVIWLKAKTDANLLRWLPGNHDEWIINSLGAVSRNARVTLLLHRLRLQALDADAADESELKWTWFKAQIEDALQPVSPSTQDLTEPHSLQFELHDDLALASTHAAPEETVRRSLYLWPFQPTLFINSFDDVAKRPEIDSARTICLLHGHTHYPLFARLVGRRLQYESIKYGRPLSLGQGYVAINPGSVGQPRDGDPRAAFALLDTEAHTVEFRRVEYDIQAVTTRLIKDSHAAKKDQDLIDSLRSSEGGSEEEIIAKIDKAYNAPETATTAEEGAGVVAILRTANGGSNLQEYQSKVYRRPDWDLIANNE